MIGRRQFLQAAGLGYFALNAPAASFASTAGDRRLVLIILRGAVDGLAVAAPYGDPDYARLRGELALPAPGRDGGLLPLNDIFGLHPSLPELHGIFERSEATVIHAVASPYRERSHFDGQDVLENGGAQVGLLRDGWLNRAIAPLGGTPGNESAIAMAQNTPLILRGTNSVTSWAPSALPDTSESTLARLADLYADDEFFATRLTQALASQEIAAEMQSMEGRPRRGNEAQQLRSLMASTANFLTAPGGPTIAVLEAGGWDTHANQGAASGQLANRFAALDTGLAELRNGLGDVWEHTVVVIATEFGRTVRVNGTRGTDHGTGTAAVLAGGAVLGGNVLSDWPGLNDLYQDRDLRPTLDIRAVFKGLLADHLRLSPSFVESTVFPDSADVKALRDLIRA